jgi:hypothetical protein
MVNLDRVPVLLIALAVGVSLAPGCGKTISETIDDTTITTRVKTALLNDPGVGGLRIDVDTFKSVVTLSGRVTSQDERDHAITLTRRVNGVTEVKDALNLEPPAPSSPGAAVTPGASSPDSALPSTQ